MGFERKSFSKNPIIFNPMRKQKVTLKVWFLFLPRRVTVWEKDNYEVIDPDTVSRNEFLKKIFDQS